MIGEYDEDKILLLISENLDVDENKISIYT